MSLTDDLQRLIAEFLETPGHAVPAPLQVTAADCWSVNIRGHTTAWPGLVIRIVTVADVLTLERFGAGLGSRSKALFYPYPWHDPAMLRTALATAIARSVNRINATYVIESAGSKVVGHFFLHDPRDSHDTRTPDVCVPVLGVAIADAWQGRHLGTLAVRLLQAIAPHFGANGIELTTLSNKPRRSARLSSVRLPGYRNDRPACRRHGCGAINLGTSNALRHSSGPASRDGRLAPNPTSQGGGRT